MAQRHRGSSWGWLRSWLPPFVRDPLDRGYRPLIPFEVPTMVIASDFGADVLRTDDLLTLRLDFYNISLVHAPVPGGLRRLVRRQRQPAYVGVTFPPQSFGEHSFVDTLGHPPIAARLSGPTYLLLKIPNTELLSTPFTLPAVLALLRRCEPVVSNKKGPPVPFTPADDRAGSSRGLSQRFTAIGAPYQLYLSPEPNTRWAHAPEPVTDTTTKRTELWHTRLSLAGSKSGEVDERGGPPRLHAVWNGSSDSDPFTMSLKPSHRDEIVDLSSNSPLDPTLRPITAEQVMLSALGAWLRVHANFSTNPKTDELPPQFSVIDWRHRMTMGRDQFVRVVELGNVFPLGHKAVLITITERKPLPLPHDPAHQGAFLRQEMYVSIREPERSYAYPGMPLTQVRITPLLTPRIIPVPIGSHGDKAIRIRIAEGATAGSEFLFEVTGRDLEGRAVSFETPLFWVANNFDTGKLQEIINEFKTVPARATRGQKIAYAPTDKPGKTSHETSSLKLTGRAPKPPSIQGQCPFLPVVEAANVRLEAVETMTGQLTHSEVRYEQRYLGGAANPAAIYLNVAARFKTALTPAQTGGLAAPNFEVGALSTFAGPVSLAPNTDPDSSGKSLIDGTFNPTSVLPAIKLLGGINLADIFEDQLVNAGSGPNIPNLTTTRSGNTIETRYEWTTQHLRDCHIFTPTAGVSTFSLIASFRQQLHPATGAPGDSNQEVTGSLTDFAITLLPGAELVSLEFQSVTFRSLPTTKTDVAINLKSPALKFLGPLRLVNEVTKFVPLDGFSDPPSLDVTTDGVTLGYSLGIPTIGIGVFTLGNISFSAGFYLPFVDRPLGMRLAFCERPQPFTLTVFGLGGGGFFGITIGLGGVQMVEMALEFGAAIALNLGVASGSVSVMGGVYYQQAGSKIMVEAYIRMNGTLRVLGLISVSCTFYLSLTYISEDDVLKGQASLSVRVKIVFFSKTVSVSVERILKGSDPTFREVFSTHPDRILEAPVDDWADYAGAFAAYA